MITKINSVGNLDKKCVLYQSKVNFKSNCRSYALPNDMKMETYTYFYRKDFPWDEFTPFIKTHFKNHERVNMINAACSDGTEAFSLIMLLRKDLKVDWEKFLPIKAYDVDKEVIRAANSGYVLLNKQDILEIKKRIKNYTKFIKEDKKEILKITNNLSEKDSDVTYKVNRKLSKYVSFEEGDIFKILDKYEDEGNTILFFRNALGHLGYEKNLEFIKLAKKKLKPGSLLTIGDFDSELRSTNVLQKNGFSKVMRNVYKRESNFQMLLNRFKCLLSKL